MTAKPKCKGPVRYEDQGIESCATCGGGCICCDFAHIDHSEAEHECFMHRTLGYCALKAHASRPCVERKQ